MSTLVLGRRDGDWGEDAEKDGRSSRGRVDGTAAAVTQLLICVRYWWGFFVPGIALLGYSCR